MARGKRKIEPPEEQGANGHDEAAQDGKGKGRRRTINAPPTNVTDATIKEFYTKALKAKREHEDALDVAKAAGGRYRSVLKAAKAAGVSPATITWRLDQRNRDPEEIDRETQDRNRIAMVTGLAIGGTLGDWLGRSVADRVDEMKIDGGDHTEVQTREEGASAYASGDPLSANPYRVGTTHCGWWNEGWTGAQMAAASKAPEMGNEEART